MKKEEAVEEFTNQPWGYVIQAVILVTIGEVAGFAMAWAIFG